MQLRYLTFSDRGEALAARLAAGLGGTVSRCGRPLSLAAWAQAAFFQAQGLVFVGAAGIAVRAIAPYLRSKTADPAVVVMDECGQFAVPILSGHLGGANDLARALAAICGAVPVLTTATDVRGVFAVDEWARRQNCWIANPERIKTISAAVLAGRTVRVYSPWPIEGSPPAGVEETQDTAECGIQLTLEPSDSPCLFLVPRILTLGIGCRRGTAQTALEEALQTLLARSGVHHQAISAAASIDRKEGEPGLLAFCRAHGWACRFYSAAGLAALPGEFTPSAFVQSVTGVDNVCERSAVCASGGGLYWRKCAGNGVTLALAQAPYTPNWRWQREDVS